MGCEFPTSLSSRPTSTHAEEAQPPHASSDRAAEPWRHRNWTARSMTTSVSVGVLEVYGHFTQPNRLRLQLSLSQGVPSHQEHH